MIVSFNICVSLRSHPYSLPPQTCSTHNPFKHSKWQYQVSQLLRSYTLISSFALHGLHIFPSTSTALHLCVLFRMQSLLWVTTINIQLVSHPCFQVNSPEARVIVILSKQKADYYHSSAQNPPTA